MAVTRVAEGEIDDGAPLKTLEKVAENPGVKKDGADIFGEYVACSIRKLGQRQQIMARNKIQQVLFEMEMADLGEQGYAAGRPTFPSKPQDTIQSSSSRQPKFNFTLSSLLRVPAPGMTDVMPPLANTSSQFFSDLINSPVNTPVEQNMLIDMANKP